MDRAAVYEIWAPPDSPWSAWAKPALFAQMPEQLTETKPFEEASWDVAWVPAPTSGTAIVLDLPGEIAVRLAVRLARLGFRPVPLINACHGPAAVVNVEPVMQMLGKAALVLRETHLPADGPPAFFLDADRMPSRAAPSPGRFDNRWLTFPQDFPSANFLLSRGLKRALLVQNTSRPQDDLAHVLLRWQQAGIEILAKNWSSADKPEPITVPRPSQFRSVWYRLLAVLGLRRNSAGGFGAVVPTVASSG